MLSDYFIFPKYLKYQEVQKKFKIKDDQIKTFDGFKEDIYIADYKVDEHFLEKLPFNDFITIRPENLKAAYVPKDATTIVPQLLKRLRTKISFSYQDMNRKRNSLKDIRTSGIRRNHLSDSMSVIIPRQCLRVQALLLERLLCWVCRRSVSSREMNF